MCFREAVIDVRTQRVQWQASLQVPLGTSDFSPVQAAADANLDALAAEALRRVHRLAHRTAEAYALFQLQSDSFRHQLCVEFGFVHFLDVDIDIAVRALLK